MAPLERISIQGFRAARQVELRPGALCALVGEASSGKSTVLTAIWMLLDAGAPVPTAEDVSHGGERVHVEADSGGVTFFLDARPPATLNLNREGAPTTLFLPASQRGDGAELVADFERLCEEGVTGLVVLIEEPELYLSPQSQRYLYRLLRRLTANGNQVLYSTHAATFLSVAHLEELALVRHAEDLGTTLREPNALATDEAFKALSEFDVERAEVFLSRSALLVEGMTEKLAFPFVFEALGYDADREAIAILECGGKANIPLFARICNEAGVPCVVVYDRDAPADELPNESEQITNGAIEALVPADRCVQLVPDFERVVGLNPRNRKPRKAYKLFSADNPIPEPLAKAVELAVALAHGDLTEPEPRRREAVLGEAPPAPRSPRRAESAALRSARGSSAPAQGTPRRPDA